MAQKMFKHIDDVEVIAYFAQEDGKSLRYRLDIKYKNAPQSGQTVCAVMQNPSYAGENVADKSVQFLENVVFQTRKKFPQFDNAARLIIVNQFALIQTKDFIGHEEAKGIMNDSVIVKAFQESDIILIAWGSGNPYEDRKKHILRLIDSMPDKKVFKTRMHPSRGQYDDFIQPFSL